MISQDDIAAFVEENQAAMDAADEYQRRFEKGLPPDRYTDGTIMDRQVGAGIRAYKKLLGIYVNACAAMLQDMEERNRSAMSAGEPESKYME